MNIDQLNKANTLIKHINNLTSALNQVNKILDNNKFSIPTETFTPVGETSQRQLHISQYHDGSGFNVDLTDCFIAEDILIATKENIQKRLTSNQEEFQNL